MAILHPMLRDTVSRARREEDFEVAACGGGSPARAMDVEVESGREEIVDGVIRGVALGLGHPIRHEARLVLCSHPGHYELEA